MKGITFIRLIEQEYRDVTSSAKMMKEEFGFSLFEKPLYICEHVQKFKNWIILAMRSSEVEIDGIPRNPEDVIIMAASAVADKDTGRPLHPDLVESMGVFDSVEFDALFGKRRRLMFEQSTGRTVSECRFTVCYEHCRFLNECHVSDVDYSADRFRTDGSPTR